MFLLWILQIWNHPLCLKCVESIVTKMSNNPNNRCCSTCQRDILDGQDLRNTIKYGRVCNSCGIVHCNKCVSRCGIDGFLIQGLLCKWCRDGSL